MTVWKRGWARSAWAAFLVLFAVQAIAGTALCELYGEHRAPPVGLNAVESSDQTLRGTAGVRTHERSSPAEPRTHDGVDHVCEEPVYLTGGLASLSTIKSLLLVGTIPWSHAPAHDWPLAVLAVTAPPHQRARPPPPCAPLDISSRLRI